MLRREPRHDLVVLHELRRALIGGVVVVGAPFIESSPEQMWNRYRDGRAPASGGVTP